MVVAGSGSRPSTVVSARYVRTNRVATISSGSSVYTTSSGTFARNCGGSSSSWPGRLRYRIVAHRIRA
jgi:hypothetical protein